MNLEEYIVNEGLKYKPMLGGQTAKSGGYKIDVFTRSNADNKWAWEIFKGSKRVAQSKYGQETDQFDVKTQAEKALTKLKKKK